MSTVAPDLRWRDRTQTVPAARRAVPRAQRQQHARQLSIALVAMDSAMLATAFWLAFLLRFQSGLPLFQAVTPSGPFYLGLVSLLVAGWLGLFAASGLYSQHNLLGGTQEYSLVFRACSIGLLVVITAGFLAPSLVIARGYMVVAWLLTFVLTGLGRVTIRRVVYRLRRRGLFLAPAIIVGANAEGLSLAQQLLSWATSGLRVVGFVDQKLPAGHHVAPHLRVLGAVPDLEYLVAQHEVEEIVLASSAYSVRDNLIEIFRRYGTDDSVNVRLSSGLYEIITTGLTVREYAYVPLVGINKVRLTGSQSVVKLLLDYGIAIPGLILIAPLLALIALVIKLDSPGPVLYRRRVMGVGGRTFDALKFRTMRTDGDVILAARPELRAELVQHGKLKDDPRLTRLGRLLRRTSLDELPQLFNVLRREMSLVGPRMIAPDEMARYERWGMNLLTVHPGITGLWQVSGRADIGYVERVQLDMYYIRNWSLWLDLQLLWQTPAAVLRGHGAY